MSKQHQTPSPAHVVRRRKGESIFLTFDRDIKQGEMIEVKVNKHTNNTTLLVALAPEGVRVERSLPVEQQIRRSNFGRPPYWKGWNDRAIAQFRRPHHSPPKQEHESETACEDDSSTAVQLALA